MLQFIPSFRRFGFNIGLGASADPMVLVQGLARFTEPFFIQHSMLGVRCSMFIFLLSLSLLPLCLSLLCVAGGEAWVPVPEYKLLMLTLTGIEKIE